MEAKIKVRHMGGKETFYTMDLLSATVQDLKQKTFRRDNIKVQCQQLTNLTTVSPQVLEDDRTLAGHSISEVVPLHLAEKEALETGEDTSTSESQQPPLLDCIFVRIACNPSDEFSSENVSVGTTARD